MKCINRKLKKKKNPTLLSPHHVIPLHPENASSILFIMRKHQSILTFIVDLIKPHV